MSYYIQCVFSISITSPYRYKFNKKNLNIYTTFIRNNSTKLSNYLSLTKFTQIPGAFSKKQYDAIVNKCNLNPKNHLMEHFPHPVSPSNVLWIRILWLQQTHKEVESTKLILVQVPSTTFLMKMVIGSNTSFSSFTKRLQKT